MKKHPVRYLFIIIIVVLAIYFVFNIVQPKYIDYHAEKVVRIKGNDYEYRTDWVAVEKDRLVGRVVQDNYDFWTRFGLIFFPDRLYSVKGDENNISYYIDPGLSEFYYGYHIYKTDIDLPELDTIMPNKIELAYHGLDLTNEAYYSLRDEEIISEILDIIKNKREVIFDYTKEEIKSLEELNEHLYDICFFDERVPGSIYALHVVESEDGKVYYTDKAKVNEEELIDITYVLHLIIENSEKDLE